MASPVDRTNWPAGPWDDEPDELTWRDETTGLFCALRRAPYGNLCGYVIVGEGHPWHGLHSDAIGALVHGGVTFSEDFGEGAWAVGFDCAHLGDVVPAMAAYGWARLGRDAYRDVAYVREQCHLLAVQAMMVTPGNER
jgi:hypothetical protein